MNILITPASESVFLNRCLWAIARSGARPDWRVVLTSHRKDDLAILKWFSSSFDWTFLLLGDGQMDMAETIKHIQGERFFVLDGDTIAWTNPSYRPQTDAEVQKKVPPTILFEKGNSALDLLLSEPEKDLVFASAYQLPATAVLDDYGAALHPRMVDYCRREPLDDTTDYLALVKRSTHEKRIRMEGGITTFCQSSQAVAVCQRTNKKKPSGKPSSILSVENNRS
jgi:hypothetical protein